MWFSEDEEDLVNTSEDGFCTYGFHFHPSEEIEKDELDETPIIFTLLAGAVFLAIACAFFLYDWFVQKRNSKIIDATAQANAIVLSFSQVTFGINWFLLKRIKVSQVLANPMG